jgi:hypothetical protein
MQFPFTASNATLAPENFSTLHYIKKNLSLNSGLHDVTSKRNFSCGWNKIAFVQLDEKHILKPDFEVRQYFSII